MLAALSRAREVADEMPVRQRTQVCFGRRERGSSTPQAVTPPSLLLSWQTTRGVSAARVTTCR